MPGWLTITDSDENSYYVTPHGKIYTSEKPDFVYKPVSKDGITYYLNQGRILTEKYDPFEGLLILKSIRLLASYDKTLHYAGVQATKLINDMRKDEGDRFESINRRASLLLCRIGDTVYLFNERTDITLEWKGGVEIIQRMSHDTHLYSADSIKIGLRLPDNEDETYDALMTMSFETYTHGKIFNIDQYLQIRKEKKRRDAFQRNGIKSDSKKQFSEISFAKGNSNYGGIEAVYAGKSGGGIILVVAPESAFPAAREAVLNMLSAVELD